MRGSAKGPGSPLLRFGWLEVGSVGPCCRVRVIIPFSPHPANPFETAINPPKDCQANRALPLRSAQAVFCWIRAISGSNRFFRDSPIRLAISASILHQRAPTQPLLRFAAPPTPWQTPTFRSSPQPRAQAPSPRIIKSSITFGRLVHRHPSDLINPGPRTVGIFPGNLDGLMREGSHPAGFGQPQAHGCTLILRGLPCGFYNSSPSVVPTS